MRFLYPLGLIGLVGVPILIAIYIIKNKHTEQTVSSTYLWTLSEKFLKRRIRVSKLAGFFALLLQLLAVIAISFTIAHPVLVLKGQADEYCFILDGSGSMNMQADGVTRFDKAKNEIEKIIDNATDGSVFTVVSATDLATGVVVEKTSDKELALEKLGSLTCAYGEVDFTEAMLTAQAYFDDNPSLTTYLFTDKTYLRHDNIKVVSVVGEEQNYAVTGVLHTHEDGELKIEAGIISYGEDANLTVQLYIDGSSEPFREKTVGVIKGVLTKVELGIEVIGFTEFTVAIAEQDAFSADNSYTVYSVDKANEYKTLIVSETPFFLKSALSVVGNTEIETVTPEYYLSEMEKKNADGTYSAPDGYGLYIFDAANPEEGEEKFAPRALPKNGAVWTFNISSVLEGSGFSFRNEMIFESSARLTLSSSTASVNKKISNGLSGEGLFVKRYLKYGVYAPTLNTIYTHDGQPLVIVGTNDHGNRQATFAFSLHDSNLPLLSDFVVLISNLAEYSSPGVVEKVNYTVGEKLEINILPGCESIEIASPSGQKSYPASGVEANEFTLGEVGVYTVTLTLGSDSRSFRLYSALPVSESELTKEENEIIILGQGSTGGLDGFYDNLFIVFIALAVVFILDWVVYCYDKYQLR